jgi:peptidoglycan/LPS O-acetylase OafA/YrhL
VHTKSVSQEQVGALAIQFASGGLLRTDCSKQGISPPASVNVRGNISIPELQSLRAVGCLIVFIAHSAVIFYPGLIAQEPGRAHTDYVSRAVVGFFILSGLVLALPFVGEGRQKFGARRFYYARFLRLYPAYWASILFALGLRFVVTHWMGLSDISRWPQSFWSEPVTPRILLEHFAGIYYSARPINPAYWTFAQETQACLLVPLMIPVVRRTRWTSGLAIVAALTVLSHYQPYVIVIRTVSYFLMGAYVAKYNRQLKTLFQNASRVVSGGHFLALALLLWLAPYAEVPYRISVLEFDGSLALLMVGVQAFRPLAAVARLRPVQKLAELSYCFYLLHLPILAGLVFVLQPHVHSAVLTAMAALTSTLMAAWLAHSCIESPIRQWKTRFRTADQGRMPGLLSKEPVAS